MIFLPFKVVSAEMGNTEYRFKLNLFGKEYEFKDRGRLGVLDNGDSITCKGKGCLKGGALLWFSYATVRNFLKELPAEARGVVRDIYRTGKNPQERRQKWTYIDLNFSHSCSRRTVRDPYGQYIQISGKHFVYDYDADDKADEARFKTSTGTEVVLKSWTYGPLMKSWDGSMKACTKVNTSRKGVEPYLKIFDRLYARGAKAMLIREI